MKNQSIFMTILVYIKKICASIEIKNWIEVLWTLTSIISPASIPS